MKVLAIISGLILQLNSLSVWAVEKSRPAEAAPAIDPLSGANIGQLAIGLLFVLLMVIGLAWLLRRVGGVNFGGSQALKVVGGMSMGARERVVLIQVGETQLLVGISPGRIQTLHVLDKPVVVQDGEQTGEGFADKFAAALKGKMK